MMTVDHTLTRRGMIGMLAVIGSLGLTGCSNSASVQQTAAASGVTRSFDAPYEKVKQAAIDALIAMQTPASETKEQPDSFVLLVSRPPHGMSWGEVGRVVVDKSAAAPTVVHVVYEKRFALQFAGSQSSFARNLYLRMDNILGTTAPAK